MLITFAINQTHLENRKTPFLLHQFCFLTFLFVFHCTANSQIVANQNSYRLVFWNVENLFDIWDDSIHSDEDFTPEGSYHWTNHRYKVKLTRITQVLTALGGEAQPAFEMPVIVGMAEIENDKVLRDLCRGTPLRQFGYDFIHYESPDQRGIDNALLYRQDHYRPFYSQAINVSDTANGFRTRDILLVEGTLSNGDTLILLVNHFPSKRGGATADKRRMQIAHTLRRTMDSLTTAHPQAAIVVMGDFNAAPDEEEIRKGLMQGHTAPYGTFTNLMTSIEPGRGTHKYQDHWSCLDQIIVSSNLCNGNNRLIAGDGMVFEADFLLLNDDKFIGKKVFRTYLGMRYQGGYSDHLPVYVDIWTGQ